MVLEGSEVSGRKRKAQRRDVTLL